MEDGTERGEGGRYRERSMNRVSTRPIFLGGQSGTIGRVQGYNTLLATAELGYIHGAAAVKIGYSSISAFATRPERHLIGWVDRF